MRDQITTFATNLGTVLRLRTFSGTIVGDAGSYYDDQITWSLVAGPTYFSGIVQPVGNRGTDAFLRAQGRILDGDLKFYVPGNISTSGMAVVIGIGSPPPTTPREYHILEPGPVAIPYQDATIYTTVYGRYLQGGSLLPNI